MSPTATTDRPSTLDLHLDDATDTAPRRAATTLEVVLALTAHGYVLAGRTDAHLAFDRGDDRLVVPITDGPFPAAVAAGLAWTLDRRLGRGWDRPPTPPQRRPGAPIELDVVEHGADEGDVVVAFVPSEPTITSFGSDAASAHDRLTDAVALWLGVPGDAVQLRSVRPPSR